MRPENKWNKQPPKGKRQRNRKGPLNAASTRSRSRAQSSKPAESSPGPTDGSSPAAEDGTTPQVDNDNNDNHNDNDNANDEGAQEPPSKRRRANSVEPRRSTDTAENRWLGQDAVEALRRAIQSSPARRIESRSIPVLDDNQENLTPKPVRRALFPSAQNDGPLKTLGDSLTNSPRRNHRKASDKQHSLDKENHAPTAHDDLDDLFENPGFEFDLLTSPTPRRRNPRPGNLLSEKRLSLPCNSPTSAKQKDVNPESTPTRLAAEKLQSVQGITGSSPRQNKTPKQSRSDIPDLPSLPGDDLHTETFVEGIDDMLMDMFRDGAAAADTGSFFPPDSNWDDWIQSDYVSPGPFGFGHANAEHQTSVLDPALFGSDSLNQDLANSGNNTKSSAQNGEGQHAEHAVSATTTRT